MLVSAEELLPQTRDGAVGPERSTVVNTGGDGDDIALARRHVGLPVVISTPSHNGPVSS